MGFMHWFLLCIPNGSYIVIGVVKPISGNFYIILFYKELLKFRNINFFQKYKFLYKSHQLEYKLSNVSSCSSKNW